MDASCAVDAQVAPRRVFPAYQNWARQAFFLGFFAIVGVGLSFSMLLATAFQSEGCLRLQRI